eukprot:CAMPEP_0178458740 /NCGR_PEP_ID=MMETSP0689_2-20121128/47704_1 /TAXON_ID=160604 /ORGANISM="Amphidinium massartii, Strain CS-259" /LENGTH=1142 /DNA_ID=CAMNT_0020085063 /DNA_START=34 /DNA_END=3459 /DNA_ORIENTATION=-
MWVQLFAGCCMVWVPPADGGNPGVDWAAPACPFQASSPFCEAWRDLAASQFPDDCSARRLLHDLDEVTDAGRAVYKVAAALAEAYHSGRVLILSPMQQRAMHAICQSGNGWECVFEPLTSCSMEDVPSAIRQALLMRTTEGKEDSVWEGDAAVFSVPHRGDMAQFFLPKHLRQFRGQSAVFMQALVTSFVARLKPGIRDYAREVQELQGFDDLRHPLIGISLPSEKPCGDLQSFWSGCRSKVDAILEAVKAVTTASTQGVTGDVLVAIETKEASQEPAELLSAREQDKVKAALLREGKKAVFLRASVQYAAALEDDDIGVSRAADDLLHTVKHMELLSRCDYLAAFRSSALSRASLLLSVARQLGSSSSGTPPEIPKTVYLDAKLGEMAWFDVAPTTASRAQAALADQLASKLKARGPTAPDPPPAIQLLSQLQFRRDLDSLALSDGVFDAFSAGWHYPGPVQEVVACDPLSESLRQELSAKFGKNAGRLFDEAEVQDDGSKEGWWKALAILTEAAWLPGSRRQVLNLRVQVFALSKAHSGRSWEKLCPRESSEGRHNESYDAQRRALAVHLGTSNPAERRANAYYMLGKLAVDYDRINSVQAPLRRALELQPGHTLANLALGKTALLTQGRYQEAAQACHHALTSREVGVKAKALECIGDAALKSISPRATDAPAGEPADFALAGLDAYLEAARIEPGSKLSNHCCTAYGRLAVHVFGGKAAVKEVQNLPAGSGGINCIGLALLAIHDMQQAESKPKALSKVRDLLKAESRKFRELEEAEVETWLQKSADRILEGSGLNGSCTALLPAPAAESDAGDDCAAEEKQIENVHDTLVAECMGNFPSEALSIVKYYYGTRRFLATVQARPSLRCWQMLSLPAVIEFRQAWGNHALEWAEEQIKPLAQNFHKTGHALMRGVLPPAVVEALRRYHRAIIDERCAGFQDLQARRFTHHNDRVDSELMLLLLPLANQVFRRELQPTYSYTGTYVRGSALKAHIDRAHTRFSLNICLGETSSEEGGGDMKPWTLYFDKKLQWKRTEREAQVLRLRAHSEDLNSLQEIPNSENDIIGLEMNPGDVFFYRGTHHYHFRKPLPHHRSTHTFLMYAEKDIFPMSAAMSTESYQSDRLVQSGFVRLQRPWIAASV